MRRQGLATFGIEVLAAAESSAHMRQSIRYTRFNPWGRSRATAVSP